VQSESSDATARALFDQLRAIQSGERAPASAGSAVATGQGTPAPVAPPGDAGSAGEAPDGAPPDGAPSGSAPPDAAPPEGQAPGGAAVGGDGAETADSGGMHSLAPPHLDGADAAGLGAGLGDASATPSTTREPFSPPDTVHIESAPPPAPSLPYVPVAAAGPSPRPRHPAADLPLPRIMAVANQKGGVGKTTTTVNLGASLAELGYRTLVVDLDPQGNATTGLGINARNLDHSIYDVLMHDLPMDECIEPTSVRNLFVAPATIDLAGAEIELVPAFSRELRLRRALAEVADSYEFTLIDCPPSLGLLTVNGLAAATEVLVPIQCEYYALEGLSQLLRNVNLVQSNLNPPLLMSAIILTMYDARTKLADQVAAEVREHFGARVCRNVVPRTVRLSEAPSFGQPIIVFDPSSRGSLAYRELAKEVSGGAPQRVG